MADFAPKLNSGVAFNQPVQAPNAMEAIAGLFSFGVDVAQKNKADKPKPTEGDKFDMAIGTFVSEKGGTFSWDKKSAREFIFRYPQFAPEMKSYLDGTGVFDTPTAVAEAATMKWFETAPGQLAVARAEGLPENQREAYLSEQATKFAQQEADLIELERNSKALAAQGTLNSGRWDALKPVSKDMVDHTVGVVLNTIVTDVTNGLTVEVDPELRAMLGLRYDKVDMNNLNAVLTDSKVFLEKQFRDTYRTNFGEDILPSDDWNKEVFSGLDGLMKIAESVKDPQARAATMKAVIDTEYYKTMDDNGLAITMRVIETMPPAIANIMIGKIAGFEDSFNKALAQDGKLFNTAGIKTSVADMSKSEAESLATDVIQTFEHGVVPEFFTAFKEALNRTGHNVVDGESFKKITGDNIPDIIKLTSTNPDFRAEFGGFLTSDIEQTISTIKSNLIAGVNLEFDGKQFVMVPEAGTLAAQKWNDPYRPYSQSAENQLPEDMNLRVLNEKIATLGLMGEFGKEIQGAIGILNTEPKAKTETKSARPPKGRGRGRVAPQDVIAGLQDRNMPQHIAEGFAMNIADESGFDTGINEANPIVEGSRGGFGLIQWTGPRRKALEAFAAGRGVPVDDLDMQLDFLMQELGGSESAAWQRISQTTTKEEAAVAILKEFLRPAEEHQKSRAAKYTSGVGPAGMPVGSLPTEDQGGSQSGSPMLSLDSGAEGISTATSGSPTASTGLSTGTMLSFESPEVQQIVEKATSAPEEAIAMAKEILNKPMDPSIKALIEALVRIGERA